MTKITKHTLEEQRQSLSAFVPANCLLAGKDIPDTRFFKLIQGLAKEFVRMECALVETQDQHNPQNTTIFIEEWEASVGIPDDCFPGTGTIEERRLHIIAKLALMNVQTRQDFIDLATLFGFTVKIEMIQDLGAVSFPLTFPITFQLSDPNAVNFVIFVTFIGAGPIVAPGFPYIFPILFADAAINIVQCLFNKLKPVDVKIKFLFAPDPSGVFDLTFPVILADDPFDIGC